jgi:MFS family permease
LSHAQGEATVGVPDGQRADPRDLRAIVFDGIAFSAMVGMGETYVPAFALAVGFDEVVAGLIATAPMLFGAILQLVTPWAVRRLRSYRRWVVACAALQALSFAPLIVGALLGRMSIVWLALAMVSYWGFGMATSPAWNAWVTALVPRSIRAHFFASRTRAAQASLFLAVLLGGLLLEWGRGRDQQLVLFASIFSAALFFRLVSATFLARQSESPGLAAGHRALPPAAVIASIRHARSGRIFAYLIGMQVAVNLASPYFTPYMLKPLGFSYAQFMVLTAGAFVSRVVVLPFLGQLAHSRGARMVLWWGAVGIVPLPAMWLISSNFWFLLVLQLYSGIAWASLELATLLSFFEGIEDRDRASVLSAYNLATAFAIALGAWLGSQVFHLVGEGAYPWLFVLSAGGRLLMLFVLRGAGATRTTLDLELRTLAVRPSAGAIARPILATATTDEPAEEPTPTR